MALPISAAMRMITSNLTVVNHRSRWWPARSVAVLFPAADLVGPLYPADPADTADDPGGVATADPALGAGSVAASWLCWEASGTVDESDEPAMVSVGMDQADCVKSRSSTQCEAVAGGCRSAATVF